MLPISPERLWQLRADPANLLLGVLSSLIHLLDRRGYLIETLNKCRHSLNLVLGVSLGARGQ